MVKTIDDYIPMLKQEYPDLSVEVIQGIINMGIKNIQDLINRDHDVRMWNQNEGRDYHVALVRSVTTDEKRKSRAYQNRVRLNKLREKRNLL